MSAKPAAPGPESAVVFGSPVAVGHVRPLMPLARRLVERGFLVVWAVSGDANEPASKPVGPLSCRAGSSSYTSLTQRRLGSMENGSLAEGA
jgi:UDP:flavonoid glycosyltransferase YjiC (YdhE family)